MRSANGKDVLTTGQVARICHVAPRTVSKWFDTGKLRGYRIPGSRDRRIPRKQLVAFMRAHDIPLETLADDTCRVLVVDEDFPPELAESLNKSGRYEVRVAANGFEAGLIAREQCPDVIVLDAAGGVEQAEAVCRKIRSHADLRSAKVLAAVRQGEQGQFRELIRNNFDGAVTKPYCQVALISTIEDAVNPAY